MPNQPIPVGKANEMILTYIHYMENLGVDMTRQTHSVSFSSTAILGWMGGISQFTDEFRICVGVYPSTETNAGRITAIVWPYKNGKPACWPAATIGKGDEGDDPGTEIDPFNAGGLNP